MIFAYLLAAPAHKVWNLPPWLTPDPERIGVNVARLVLTLLAAWLIQRLLFLLVRRGEQWLVRAAHETGHGVQRARTIGQILRHAVTAMVGAWVCVHVQIGRASCRERV